ncbi:MAG: class III poly(R)-hydroxyalkanoic acid synthase subunit PhaC [Lachnospiraceae bacterium]|nr:class III poly(R)-hydroxyalkanoic acid synthase subunit PhaC [Lachnospiraceae bacterium]
MSENIFEKSLAQYQEMQKTWMENAVALTEKFDPAKYMEQMQTMQENVINGMQTLLSLTPEDVASDQLEKEEVLRIGKMRLFHYAATVPARKKVKTPLLITYALVNRQYMLDLQPDRSVIKSFLDAGLDVYIIDWGYPTAEDMYLTLDDHINWYLDECVDFVRKDTKKDQINILGICQGGTFSTIYTALHQEKIKNIITLVVPIDFSSNDGMLFRWSRYMNIDSLIEAYNGVVPGDVMNIAYLILKPLSLTMDKYVGMTDKWMDKDFLTNFIRMEKWTFDSPAQVGATLSQFIKDMYQDNKLIKGELELGGQTVDLKNITIPVLCACADRDHLVPLSASEPFMDALGSKDKTFLHFPTGHIGMFTSSRSRKEIIPGIIDWIKERSK